MTSVVLVVLVALFLKKSKMGKAMRAVANDPELANISGIDSNRVILRTFVIGSALAGIAGKAGDLANNLSYGQQKWRLKW